MAAFIFAYMLAVVLTSLVGGDTEAQKHLRTRGNACNDDVRLRVFFGGL